ncbi:MAG: xanthine dehydrogenase small subunit [Alphaproteobacteria bacterium]|nr:xanthine dehydrogenase small subunit [Alphaproteobacteria bacterium]
MPPKTKPHAEDHATIRFMLNDELREVDDIDPNTTVLNYLRLQEQETGTKEGCAEGDCGACSVVLGEVDNGRIRYRTVNACILFLPVVDGKQLITVEGLRQTDGSLHPVQQALVDLHGSQCGFCTPGFVMSMFALYKHNPSPTRQQINDCLAGNLCRCTGYRPIVEAAANMHGYGKKDHFSAAEKRTVKLLKSLQRSDTLLLKSGNRRYFAPISSDGVAEIFARNPDACLLAGGTDVGLIATKDHKDLDTLIYTGGARDLASVEVGGDSIEIGAAATYSDALDAISREYDDFGEVLRRLGSVQVRNAGTMVGNIGNASPIGDSSPLLIALDAKVILRKGAKRRTLDLGAFFVGYRKTQLRRGEFIEKIVLPRSRPDTVFRAYKISKRFDQDISAACGAFAVRLEGGRVRDIRICFGGMAATPKRATAAEAAIKGRVWSLSTVSGGMAAMESDYEPLTDMRASRDYRLTVAKNLLYKFYLETTDGAAETRVVAYGT